VPPASKNRVGAAWHHASPAHQHIPNAATLATSGGSSGNNSGSNIFVRGGSNTTHVTTRPSKARTQY
jgi:hypothetical protein